MSPIAASSSKNIVASGASGQAQGSKSPASASDQGFNALLQSGMVQPPQPIQAPPDPPKAVVGRSANHQGNSNVSAATSAASQAGAAETSNQPPAQVSNETVPALSPGSKGPETGLHLGALVQSLVDKGSGLPSFKASIVLDSNSATKANGQVALQSTTPAISKNSSGTQVQSGTKAASVLAAIQDPKVSSTQSSAPGSNSTEAALSTSVGTPTTGSKIAAHETATNPLVQVGPATANAAQTPVSELATSQVSDPAIKVSSPGTNLINGNSAVNPDPGLQGTSASSLAPSAPIAASKSEVLAATKKEFLLPADLRATTASSELSKSSGITGNANAASMLATTSHPSQPFEVISLTGSAQGLDGIATNLANFVIKGTNPISEMPKVTIMTLEPKDLGTIVVKMTMDGSSLQMELGVSNPHVSAMLNASLEQLKESISTASGMSVHIGFSSNPNPSGQGRQGTQTPRGAASASQYMGDPKPVASSPWPAQQPFGSSNSHRLDRRI